MSRHITKLVEDLHGTIDRLRNQGSMRDLDGLDLVAIDRQLQESLYNWRTIRNTRCHISRLSSEMLTIIFRMAQVKDRYSEEDDRGTTGWPVLVSTWTNIRQVCRPWRSAVDTCAGLWSDVVVNERDTLKGESSWYSTGEHLGSLLRKSRQVPLNVSIYLPESTSLQSYSDVIPSLIPHLSRARMLKVTWAPNIDDNLLEAFTNASAPKLKALLLDFIRLPAAQDDTPSDTGSRILSKLLDGGTPALQSLCIKGSCYSMTCGFRGLRQLVLSAYHFRGSEEGVLDLLEHCSATLEDLMLCSLRSYGESFDSPPRTSGTRRCVRLPNLKKFAFLESSRSISSSCSWLSQLELPSNVFVYSTTNDINGGERVQAILDLASRIPTDINQVTLAWMHNGRGGTIDFASNSAACKVAQVYRFRSFFPIIGTILKTARELWLDCSLDVIWSPYYHCRDIFSSAHGVTKLYLRTDDASYMAELCRPSKTPGQDVQVYCPLLQEIHLLFTNREIRQLGPCNLVRPFEALLKTRRELGFPVPETVYLYFDISQADKAKRREKRILKQLAVALQPLTRLERKSPGEFPAMRVPEHCTVQSGGMWDWPTWGEQDRPIKYWTSVWSRCSFS